MRAGSDTLRMGVFRLYSGHVASWLEIKVLELVDIVDKEPTI